MRAEEAVDPRRIEDVGACDHDVRRRTLDRVVHERRVGHLGCDTQARCVCDLLADDVVKHLWHVDEHDLYGFHRPPHGRAIVARAGVRVNGPAGFIFGPPRDAVRTWTGGTVA